MAGEWRECIGDEQLLPEPKLRLTCLKLAVDCSQTGQAYEEIIKAADRFFHYIVGTPEIKS